MTARLILKMAGAIVLWFAIAFICISLAIWLDDGDGTGGACLLAGLAAGWTIIGMWRRRPKSQRDPNRDSVSPPAPVTSADPNAWLYGSAPADAVRDAFPAGSFDDRMAAAVAASEEGRTGAALRNLASAGPALARDAVHNFRHWEDNPELKAKKEALIAKHEGKRRERQEATE